MRFGTTMMPTLVLAGFAWAGAEAEPATPPPLPDASEILGSMGRAAAELRDYTMTLVRQERFADTLSPEETILEKWSRPQRIYVKVLAGAKAGQEAIFDLGRNGNRLKAHKGSFPDITLNLDPRGSWAMSGNHHSLAEVSLPNFVRIVLENVAEARRRGEGRVEVAGRETLWGRPAFKLVLESPPGGRVVALGEGETLWDVARATGQAIGVILHANRGRGFTRAKDPRPGDPIFVPRYYGSRVELWVDEELRLPIRALILDHDGKLFERYEHRDLRVDVGLTDADFDPRNPGYRF